MKQIKCILQNKKTSEYLSHNYKDLDCFTDIVEKNDIKLKKYIRFSIIFDSITEATNYLKENHLKKSDYNIIELKKGYKKINDLIINEAFEYYDKYKENERFCLNIPAINLLNYLDILTRDSNSTLSIKDYLKNDIENEKVKKIHIRQFLTDADRASILLLQENSKNEMLINNLNASDGTCKVAIVKKSENLIPDYYKRSKIVINGKFKIMLSDCAENYSDDGVEIEGFYFIYQVGFSYIFEQLDN